MNQLSEPETEALLRDSLDHLAARAPDGHDVRNALARAGQKKPRRASLVLAAAAAAVVAVLGVTLGVQVVMTQPAMTPAAWRPVLSYSPGWLPDGFAEVSRSGGPGITPQVRRWSAGPTRITTSVYSTADPQWSATALRIASLPDQVVLHGRVGMITGDVGWAALLTWLLDDTHVLTVQVDGVPEARDVAQKIADSMSVKPVQVRGELRFGPLPTGFAEVSTTVRGTSAADATTELAASSGLRAAVADGSPGLGGTTGVTVRGVAGHYRDGILAVQLPSGRWLTVSGRQPEAVLENVANAAEIDPSPDYSWVGREGHLEGR